MKLSAAQRWTLCLYVEYTDAASLAQKLADDAFESSALDASAQFYRAAVRLHESETLVAALQSARDEAEYERFALRIQQRNNDDVIDSKEDDTKDEVGEEALRSTFLQVMVRLFS